MVGEKNCAEAKGIRSANERKRIISDIKRDKFLYLLILPMLVLTIFFSYIPMPGILMAFKEYDVFKGFFNSPWVGFDNFKEIFTIPSIRQSIFNTLTLSFISTFISFPIPIIFALLLNEVKNTAYKRIVQTVSYMPHFLSWVAAIGIAFSFYSTDGIINDLRVMIFGEGTERIRFLASQSFFVPNVVIIGLWKSVGWSSIVFLSAITGVDPELYDAAKIDGANKFQQCIHVTMPSIIPTAVVLLILSVGSVLKDNFQLIYGLQNAFIDYETLSTVIYKQGIGGGDYSTATALGLFQSVVGFLLVAIVNKISKKTTESSLW